jgi:regulator of sigma E protease
VSFLVSALAFLLLISVLILIHEWGHYITARLAGVMVEEFGLGLPPRAKTIAVRKGTVFSLNWIPFGGYVRLKGESTTDPQIRFASGSFASAPALMRIVILLAGVFMNTLLAYAILVVGFAWGGWIPTYPTIDELQAGADRGEIALEWGVLVDDVKEGSPAEAAGVVVGSFLTKVNGTPVTFPEDVVKLQEGRNAVTYTLLLPAQFAEEWNVTVALEDGKAGVALAQSPRTLAGMKRPLGEALQLSNHEVRVVLGQTMKGVRKLFRSLLASGEVPEEISGLVGIARITHASVQEGFFTYLRLVAMLSLSLAVLNTLPFPALDGGRLILVLLECGLRRPLHHSAEMALNTIGFALIFLMIVIVTMSDIMRLFQT